MPEPKTINPTEQAIKKIAVASNVAVVKLNKTAETAAAKIIKASDKVALELVKHANVVSEALTKLTATQAEAAVKVVNTKSPDDHELISRIDERLIGLQKDVTEIKTGTTATLINHTGRLEKIETAIGINLSERLLTFDRSTEKLTNYIKIGSVLLGI